MEIEGLALNQLLNIIKLIGEQFLPKTQNLKNLFLGPFRFFLAPIPKQHLCQNMFYPTLAFMLL